jgi:hypothetical protein
MDYRAIFTDAVEAFARDYEKGNLSLRTRWDLQALLFHYCLKVLSQHQTEQAPALHCGVELSSPRDKVDLMLGSKEVVALVRLEPDYPGLSPTQKPFVFSDDIQRDFEQLRSLCQNGIPNGFAVVLDEDGRHLQALPTVPWRKLTNGEREAYLLVRRFTAPDKADDSPG